MDNLTNDAKFLLSKMYAKYIERRKSGMIKKDATKFGDLEEVHETIMPEWPIEDVKYTLTELRQNDFVAAKPASSTYILISLKSNAIAQLETSFKDKIDLVLDYAAKIKELIPFI